MTEVARTQTKPPRQWGRTAQTRERILGAARDVFFQRGYTEANMSEIVDRSGLSVGSIYHHFGGKAELFVALWQELEDVYTEAAGKAIMKCRSDGEVEPIELFLAGAGAYLEVARNDKLLVRLFRSGDSPPGFDTISRRMGSAWLRGNMALLGFTDDPPSRLKAYVLTSIVGAGEFYLSETEDARDADAIISATLEMVRKAAS